MLTIKDPILLVRCWTWLLLALIGGELGDDRNINGAGSFAKFLSARLIVQIADQSHPQFY